MGGITQALAEAGPVVGLQAIPAGAAGLDTGPRYLRRERRTAPVPSRRYRLGPPRSPGRTERGQDSREVARSYGLSNQRRYPSGAMSRKLSTGQSGLWLPVQDPRGGRRSDRVRNRGAVAWTESARRARPALAELLPLPGDREEGCRPALLQPLAGTVMRHGLGRRQEMAWPTSVEASWTWACGRGIAVADGPKPWPAGPRRRSHGLSSGLLPSSTGERAAGVAGPAGRNAPRRRGGGLVLGAQRHMRRHRVSGEALHWTP